jgi:hypothetical protein
MSRNALRSRPYAVFGVLVAERIEPVACKKPFTYLLKEPY